MKAAIKFLETDQIIQILIFLLAGAVTVIDMRGLLFILPLLIFWQLISMVLRYHLLPDKDHAPLLCLLTTIACCMILGLFDLAWSPIGLIFFIIPVAMVINYYYITAKTLENLKENTTEFYDLDETILDDECVTQ